MRAEFPQLVSYTRFVELIPSPLLLTRIYSKERFMHSRRQRIEP